MQESLNRVLNGVSEQAALATDLEGKGEEHGKGDKKGARNRSSSNGPRGDAKGRSASPGNTKENCVAKTLVMLFKRVHAHGEKNVASRTRRNDLHRQAHTLGPEKAQNHVHVKFGENCRELHGSPSFSKGKGKGKLGKEKGRTNLPPPRRPPPPCNHHIARKRQFPTNGTLWSSPRGLQL